MSDSGPHGRLVFIAIAVACLKMQTERQNVQPMVRLLFHCTVGSVLHVPIFRNITVNIKFKLGGYQIQ